MKNKKEQIRYSFWVSLFVSMTFCVFGPLEMIMSNTSEFWFSVADVLTTILLCAVLAFGIVFAVSFLISHVSFLVYPVLLGLGLALYIQGNFTFVSYGVMDGRTIDWDSFGAWPFVNTLIWVLLIAAPIVLYILKREWFHKLVVFVPGIIVAMQLVTLGTLAFTTDLDKAAQGGDAYLSVQGIDEVSKHGNVAVFVMDTFDDEYFKEILAEDPAFLEPLDGFTYFANNTGMYPTTKGAMPFILSGQRYFNEQPYADYINEAYYKTDYYTDLKQAGYDISIYSKMMFLNSEGVLEYVSNVEGSGMEVSSYTGLLSTIYKATAFRYFPHIAKKSVWYYSGDFDVWKTASADAKSGYYTTENLDLYNAIKEGKLHLSDSSDKFYKLYYCYGVHPPYKLQPDMTEVVDGTGTYLDASKGCLNIVYEYIAQLKTLGVYDQTTIILTADHGKTPGFSNPVFLVKPRNESGSLTISNAPVSQEDLFATVMSDIGLNEAQKYGYSAFDYTEGENRDRKYFYYTWDEDWNADYLPTIIEYAIPPESNDPSAFTLGKYEGEPYHVGDRLSFTAEDQSGLSYCISGLSGAETRGTWTNAKNVYLGFKIDTPVTSDLMVSVDIINVYTGSQDVTIYLDEYELFHKTMIGAETIDFRVPAQLIQDGVVGLKFVLPDADSPLRRGDGRDSRILALSFNSMIINYAEGDPIGVSVPAESQETLPNAASAETLPASEESGFSITDIVAIPLTALMMFCHKLLGNYGLTILVFTLLSKVILLPVSLWVHKNGITMVKITPEVNRIKIKHFGDKDTIDDETQALYKREKYNPLASTVPMIVQIIMLLGVIGAVKNLLAGADSVLTLVPSEAGGVTYLMPVAAGVAALVLGLAQNHLSPLQREQGKKEQWMSNGFSIAISLFLGAFVSLGVGIYWIASNLLSIAQQLLLNVMIRPEKYIDYEALEASKKELAGLEGLSAEVSKEDKKREQEDYKKFFSVANKHLVIYSEKSGFYKYYKDVMDFMLKYSNVIIHYVTNDPKDQIFKLAEEQPRIKPYYISEKKLITLLMKMDADIVVMTCPDLDRFHLKRSYVRKDIEYVYMFHYPLSTHMVLNNGALDHYDTILCVGEFQFEEIRAAERLYNLPQKKLVSAGYGQLEQLYNSYQKMEKGKRSRPKILIAPSWQQDNILDSCIDPLLEQLLDRGYEVVVRPHPEYVKRYKPRMDAIVQRYADRVDSGLVFELDFTSNDSLFNSDIIISDWSGSAYEFSLVTLKPAVFVNTPPKINNPEYDKLNVEPLEFKLRGEVGIQIDPNDMKGLDQKINELLENSEAYAERIQQIRDRYIANFGRSGEVGGKYILDQLLERQKKK